MKPLGPDNIRELIDGEIMVFVYFRADPKINFKYQNKTPQPSKTAKYRVANQKAFLDQYIDEMNKGFPFLLDPGELVERSYLQYQI